MKKLIIGLILLSVFSILRAQGMGGGFFSTPSTKITGSIGPMTADGSLGQISEDSRGTTTADATSVTASYEAAIKNVAEAIITAGGSWDAVPAATQTTLLTQLTVAQTSFNTLSPAAQATVKTALNTAFNTTIAAATTAVQNAGTSSTQAAQVAQIAQSFFSNNQAQSSALSSVNN